MYTSIALLSGWCVGGPVRNFILKKSTKINSIEGPKEKIEQI